jgi:hypothetical protein
MAASAESGVIQRTRKFTAAPLARTFVLGFLQSPTASDEKLAQMAVPCGAAVTLGQKERLPCRLLAWRLPQEPANRRRQKLRRELMKKKGREPSAERLAWCDWTILVTNVPGKLLTPPEAAVLYRARRQVELLFKRWKSLGYAAVLSGSTAVRQMAPAWSRLPAAVIQPWLMVGTIWGDPSRSLDKVWQAVQPFVGRLAVSLGRLTELERAFAEMRATFAKTSRRDKRSKPGTFELLNDITPFDFELT